MAADTSGILALLPKDRLRQLALTHDVRVASSGTAVELATALGRSGRLSPRVLADRLFRDELRAACKHLAIPFHGQSRAELAASFLEALGVVMDDARALVTSANFTERGEKRNVEAGALVSDIGFAKSLAGQFRRLASLGAMVRVR